MPSTKNLTVRYLRDLARKHLGAGHSKLKTKEELIAALKKIVPGLVAGAPEKKTARREPAAAKRAEAPRKVAAKVKKALKAEAPAALEEPPPPTRALTAPAEIVRFDKPSMVTPKEPLEPPEPPPPAAEPLSAPLPPPPATAAPTPPPAPPEPPPRSWTQRGATPAEPLLEGFFVAKVAGELEARRHHLTEDQVAPPTEHGVGLHYQELLPEIPGEYLDDRVVLLGRDPHSAYVYWDFRHETRRAAFEGLFAPHVVMRVLENGHLLRVLDVALESRSFYIHGLHPGRPYRVEFHAVGSDGSTRRIGAASNTIVLPSDDVSPDTTVRFMRVPWGVPLNRLREGLHAGRVAVRTPIQPVEPLEITHTRWVPMPNSGSWQLVAWVERIPGEAPPGGGGAEWPVAYREVPTSGASWWTSPTSPWGGSGSGRG